MNKQILSLTLLSFASLCLGQVDRDKAELAQRWFRAAGWECSGPLQQFKRNTNPPTVRIESISDGESALVSFDKDNRVEHAATLDGISDSLVPVHGYFKSDRQVSEHAKRYLERFGEGEQGELEISWPKWRIPGNDYSNQVVVLSTQKPKPYPHTSGYGNTVELSFSLKDGKLTSYTASRDWTYEDVQNPLNADRAIDYGREFLRKNGISKWNTLSASASELVYLCPANGDGATEEGAQYAGRRIVCTGYCVEFGGNLTLDINARTGDVLQVMFPKSHGVLDASDLNKVREAAGRRKSDRLKPIVGWTLAGILLILLAKRYKC